MHPQKQLSRWMINFHVMTQGGTSQFRQGVAATQHPLKTRATAREGSWPAARAGASTCGPPCLYDARVEKEFRSKTQTATAGKSTARAGLSVWGVGRSRGRGLPGQIGRAVLLRSDCSFAPQVRLRR